MHVVTKAQTTRIVEVERENADTVLIKAMSAAQAINDILDNWGSMSEKNGRACADRLRALADRVDGLQTATGEQNTYYY